MKEERVFVLDDIISLFFFPFVFCFFFLIFIEAVVVFSLRRKKKKRFVKIFRKRGVFTHFLVNFFVKKLHFFFLHRKPTVDNNNKINNSLKL